jgi:hypothetical protein
MADELRIISASDMFREVKSIYEAPNGLKEHMLVLSNPESLPLDIESSMEKLKNIFKDRLPDGSDYYPWHFSQVEGNVELCFHKTKLDITAGYRESTIYGIHKKAVASSLAIWAITFDLPRSLYESRWYKFIGASVNISLEKAREILNAQIHLAFDKGGAIDLAISA